jgi:hypothetical protein
MGRWHNFFDISGMNDNVNKQSKQDRQQDEKCTAGDLPEKVELFEDTSWEKNADHSESATEAERKNVSKTLPETAAREDRVKGKNK